MFAVLLITVMLAVLLTPSWIVVRRGKGLRAVRVLIGQVVVATALIVLADRVGLLNPAGYTLGMLALSLSIDSQIRPLTFSN